MNNGYCRGFGLVAAVLLIGGCTSLPFSSPGDADPLYKVENQPAGFTISTTHTRRQEDLAAVESACRQGLVRNAEDLARSLGRPIQAIEERRARVKVSRDRAAGVTKCEGSLPVMWVR